MDKIKEAAESKKIDGQLFLDLTRIVENGDPSGFDETTTVIALGTPKEIPKGMRHFRDNKYYGQISYKDLLKHIESGTQTTFEAEHYFEPTTLNPSD